MVRGRWFEGGQIPSVSIDDAVAPTSKQKQKNTNKTLKLQIINNQATG